MAFLPGESRNITIDHVQDLTFDLYEFIEQVFNDDYILIIGSEVVLDPGTVTAGSGDVNSYILSVINELQRSDCSSFDDVINKAGANVDPIRALLTNENFLSEMSIEDISPELRSLIETCVFKTVITTTSDSYVEMLLRSVWGNSLRVVNVANERSLNDFRGCLREFKGNRVYSEPTLIYAFGKAERNESMPFARTDADYIYFIERWMKFDVRNDPFINLIQKKKLLALGCRFEDWYFRFFWYVLRHDVKRMGFGQVAVALDPSDRADANLEAFFKRYRIYNHDSFNNSHPMCAKEFMRFITETITSPEDKSQFRQMILDKRRKKGIFISYCHEDEAIASKLFFMLSRHFPNVWIDTEKLKAGDYNQEIVSAISEAIVFIPILSPTVARHLDEDDDSHYYRTEWSLATQRIMPEIGEEGVRYGAITILPLAVNGYDLHADYHISKFETLLNCHNHGVNLMAPSGFDRLLESIDFLLK